MRLRQLGLGLAISTLAASAAPGAIQFNEILTDPPGGTGDNGFEFLELISNTGGAESMTGLSVLVFEGDGASQGILDKVLSLDAKTTGSNGLFLWRDAATVLDPAPAPETVVHVEDFVADIENGTQTYLLVSGFSGAAGTNYDADDNGVLDSTPWTSVLDVFAVNEGDTANVNTTYAEAFGGPTLTGVTGLAIRAVIRLPDGTIVGANTTSGPPYVVTTNTGSIPNDGTYTLTPGSHNPAVPEPASLGLLAAGALLAVRRPRRT